MKAAALFDLDGTLLTGASAERVFLRHLLLRRQLGLRALRGWIRALGAGWPSPSTGLLLGNKGYLAGLDREDVSAMARHCFATRLAPCISSLAVAAIGQHKAQGHLTGILSGSLDLLVEIFRVHLGLDFGYGTPLQTDGSFYTGRMAGQHPRGQGKVAALRHLVEAHGIDPAQTHGYADEYADRFFLEAVAHPVAWNPDRRLRRYARVRGWRIECG